MLAATLAASLSRNMSTDKGDIWAGKGTFAACQDF